MKKIVVLNGIHTSGKSTVGKYLGQNGYNYYSEIAMGMHSNGDPIGTNGYNIQFKIMEKEKQRDLEILANDKYCVVESWHSAELAHARINDSEDEKRIEQGFFDSLTLFDPLFIYLEIKPETINIRGSKIYSEIDGQVLNFYRDLDDSFKKIFKKYNLNTQMVKADNSLEEVCQTVKRETYNHIFGK